MSEQQKKRGAPLWRKLIIVCGIALLMPALLLAAPLVLGIFIDHALALGDVGGSRTTPITDHITDYMDGIRANIRRHRTRKILREDLLNELVPVIDALKTDGGAIEMYYGNLRLMASFPIEADWLSQVSVWRSKIIDLPLTDASGGKMKIYASRVQMAGISISRLEIRHKKTRVSIAWEDGEIAIIDIQ